eukprot:COSAG05_NODE_1675_length_4295_cov_7.638465_2_plen_149_part_00
MHPEFGSAIEGLHWASPALTTTAGPHRCRERLIIGTGGGFEIDQFTQWPALAQPPTDQLVASQLLHALLEAIKLAEDLAPRFVLQKGQALLVDNWRMLHARGRFGGKVARLVHRVHWWTDDAGEETLRLARRVCDEAWERRGSTIALM